MCPRGQGRPRGLHFCYEATSSTAANVVSHLERFWPTSFQFGNVQKAFLLSLRGKIIANILRFLGRRESKLVRKNSKKLPKLFHYGFAEKNFKQNRPECSFNYKVLRLRDDTSNSKNCMLLLGAKEKNIDQKYKDFLCKNANKNGVCSFSYKKPLLKLSCISAPIKNALQYSAFFGNNNGLFLVLISKLISNWTWCRPNCYVSGGRPSLRFQ